MTAVLQDLVGMDFVETVVFQRVWESIQIPANIATVVRVVVKGYKLIP
jgi:hypothetical protein